MGDAGSYVYGIAWQLDRGVLADLAAVAGAPVRTLEEAGLVALLSTVGWDDFGEDALRQNLEDLGWLEATARAHHRVVDRAAAGGPVVPLGLATVYYGDQRVRELLADNAGAFAAVLERLTGRVEWGVKAYADPDSHEPAAGGEAGASSPSGPGADYLRRRRDRRRHLEEAKASATERADRVHQTLRGLATATRLHPPQDPGLTGRSGWMLLNGSYLVDVARRAEFTALVHRLAEEPEALDVELTGPWAPYSFAALAEGPA